MRGSALSITIALAGCATLRNPDAWDTGNELGVFVAPAPARFSEPPQRVDHDVIAVERRAPSAPVSTEPDGGSASVVGGVGRVGVVFAHHVVAGLEFEGGGARSEARDPSSTSSAVHLGGAAVLGLTARQGRISVGAELVAGLRKLERHSDDGDWFFLRQDRFLETRLRVHVWVASWLAVGVYAAFDDTGSRGTGLRLIGSIPESARRR